ncbi:MAG: flavodoxin family protein [Spirochaetales bacterium]|nr:flavodoxin family protein [Spirochaetales bacterium]
MKVLAIIGSARKKGNTSALVNRVLAPFLEAGAICDTVYLSDLNLMPCTGCEACADTNKCVKKDGMQDVYPLLREADVLIAGSPTYFYNMSGLMKMFIDRCYCLTSYDREDRSAWISELESGPSRIAGLISICEQESEADLGFTADAMAAAFGSLGYRIVFNRKVLHAFKPGEVLEKDTTLEDLDRGAAQLYRTARLLKEKNTN